MDVTEIRRICLEYAVRHKCLKAFEALYSRDVISEDNNLDFALFAIRRVIYNNEVEKFPTAIDILHRIYMSREKGLRNQLKVYLRLICHMKMRLFSWAIKLDNQEEMYSNLQVVISGKSTILEDEDESTQNKAQQMMWGFYRLVMPILNCPASRMDYLSDVSDCVSSVSTQQLTKLMDKFSSQIFETLPPCELDMMIMKLRDQDASHPVTEFEELLQDVLKDKHSLTDEELLGLIERTYQQDENNNEIHCKDTDSVECQSDSGIEMAAIRKTLFEQASLRWDKESLLSMDDLYTVVVPSVSEDMSSIELSDLEETDLNFRDNKIVRTPDLGSFLKGN